VYFVFLVNEQIELSTSGDEQQENKPLNTNEQGTTTITVADN
jgi:hypothetical protein